MKLPHKFKIAVGGCPNNCVKPDLNDLGIIGQLIPNFDGDECNGCKKCGVAEICPIGAAVLEDGELKLDAQACNNCGRCVDQCHFDAMDGGTFAYKIYIGGRWGKSVAVGKALGKLFATKEEALSVIEKALLLYREQGKTGERFATTIERMWSASSSPTRFWSASRPSWMPSSIWWAAQPADWSQKTRCKAIALQRVFFV